MAKSKQERKPLLVIYDDYSCEMTHWSGKVQTYDLTTPLDFAPHRIPVMAESAFQQAGGRWPVKFDYLFEGEVRFTVRERPVYPVDLSIPSNIILGGQDA